MASPSSGGPASTAIPVTVAIPTYRRPQQLTALLDGLARQEDPPGWELVVVDNDQGRSGRPVVTAVEEHVDVPVRYVVEPRSGAAHARNRALAEAGGSVIAFLDDDVIPDPGWLRAITAPLLRGEADVAGGRVVLDPRVPRPRWFDDGAIGGYLTHFDLGPDRRPLADDEIIVTANAAFRRDLLRAAGGFDVALGPRGTTQLVSDDVQVLRAVQDRGARAWWVPGALVTHELPASRLRPRWLLHRAYLQGRSDWIVDRPRLTTRRFHGARIALTWLGTQLQQRTRDGPFRPDVAFHALCDIARTLGALREALVQTIATRR